MDLPQVGSTWICTNTGTQYKVLSVQDEESVQTVLVKWYVPEGKPAYSTLLLSTFFQYFEEVIGAI